MDKKTTAELLGLLVHVAGLLGIDRWRLMIDIDGLDFLDLSKAEFTQNDIAAIVNSLMEMTTEQASLNQRWDDAYARWSTFCDIAYHRSLVNHYDYDIAKKIGISFPEFCTYLRPRKAQPTADLVEKFEKNLPKWRKSAEEELEDENGNH